MTYTFKLSRRLAGLRPASFLVVALLASSCASDDPNGPSDSLTPESPATLDVYPDSAALGEGQSVQFVAADDASWGDEDLSQLRRRSRLPSGSGLVLYPAEARLASRGAVSFRATPTTTANAKHRTMAPAVQWSATGGTIDSSGKYTAGSTPGNYRVIAALTTGPADTAAITVTTIDPVVAQLVLTPATASLSGGGSTRFVAIGKSIDGTTVAVIPRYSATGGAVSADGDYTASSAPGVYRVVATDSASGRADTSTVTITATAPAPTLQAIVVAPASVTIAAAGNQLFTASGRMSDGSSSPVEVSWSGTGGTVSSTGLYTAAPTSGTYRVIATLVGGSLADTAVVTIPAQTPPPEATGVPILVGQSIQAAVNSQPAGTAFLIKAGRHVRQSVVPKHGNVFRCEAGAVLDGENATTYAFARSGADPDNVRIVGCVVERYAPPAQMGAILAGGHSAGEGTTGWIIDSTEVRNNSNLGIRVGNGTKVRWNYVHHNGRLGIGGVGSDVLVEGNEIAYNNPTGAGLGFESGATKFVLTRRLILRNNFVHHNEGPGLWADIGNDGFLIEGNRMEDNLQEGIVTETSYGGVIRNNVGRRNGLRDSRRNAWPWGACIGIHSSGGTGLEVYGNTCEGNAHGIALIQQLRGTSYPNEPTSGIDPEMYVKNVWVHDNVVVCGPGSLSVAAAVQDAGSTAIFTSRYNRFTGNRYTLTGCSAQPHAWMNAWRTGVEWRGYGQDATP